MENKSHCLSKYLTKKENDFIVESVGNRAICLSIGVAQLWLDLSKRQVWSLYGQGAAVFVRDPIRKGFFIVFVDLITWTKNWEQEVYAEMKLKSYSDDFHMFESDNGVAAVSFAFKEEGVFFREVINERIEKRNQRIMQITSTPAQTYKFHDHQPTKNLLPFTESNALAFSKSTPNLTDEIDTRRTKAGGGGGSSWNPFSRQKPPRFLKEEISSPSNFVHVAGVKPSSQGFHMVGSLEAATDPMILEFLKHSGLQENVMNNPAEREKIMRFVHNHNVTDLVHRHSVKRMSRPVVHQRRALLKEIEEEEETINRRIKVKTILPKDRNSRLQSSSKVNQPESFTKSSSVPQPPPPPPPPPTPFLSPKPIKSEEPIKQPQVNFRANLMDEIRGKGGVQNAHLNHVDPEIDLKKETFDDDDDITKALLRGLEKIKTANQGSDTDDDSIGSDASWSEEDC